MNGNRRRMPLPQWLLGVKGCRVCGIEDHIENRNHSQDEVTKGARQLKEKNVRVMLNEEDLGFVAKMFDQAPIHDEEETDDDSENGGDQDYRELLYMADEDMGEIQEFMSVAAFLHGRTITASRDKLISEMFMTISTGHGTEFKGVKIDTAENRNAIMCMIKYDAY